MAKTCQENPINLQLDQTHLGGRSRFEDFIQKSLMHHIVSSFHRFLVPSFSLPCPFPQSLCLFLVMCFLHVHYAAFSVGVSLVSPCVAVCHVSCHPTCKGVTNETQIKAKVVMPCQMFAPRLLSGLITYLRR